MLVKIGIDASRLRNGMTGVGRYTEGVLGFLDEAMPETSFVLYAKRECSFVPPSPRWSIRLDRHAVWSQLPTTYWIHYRLGSIARSDSLDALWAPNTLLPESVPKGVASVVTVHDFNHILVPETLPPITRLAHRKWFDNDVQRADQVVTVSKGTAVRMLELLGRSTDAIAKPAAPARSPIRDPKGALRSLAELGVRLPFLLTVGTRAPRKNIAAVVDAVKVMKKRGQLINHQLVMAGADSWDKGNRRTERSDDHDWIMPLGYVDNDTLRALYTFTDALVFPSLYEGFGMPVFEARSIGCRVVTTDSPELREAGGSDAVYVEPTLEGVIAGLEVALSQPAPSARELEHDWSDAARVMASVFRNTLRKSM